MAIDYEWDVEEMDGEEIVDHHFCDSFSEARDLATEGNMKIVLVCRVENWDRGTTAVSWAYLGEDGSLPEFFTDAGGRATRKVPKKFHAEIG